MQALRTRLNQIWISGAADEPTIGLINVLLVDTKATVSLTRIGETQQWRLRLSSPDAPLAQQLGADIAMALTDVIRSGELRRLKTCAARDCDAAVIDLSRNRSRIFCDAGTCGNRQHVAAYRRRHVSA